MKKPSMYKRSFFVDRSVGIADAIQRIQDIHAIKYRDTSDVMYIMRGIARCPLGRLRAISVYWRTTGRLPISLDTFTKRVAAKAFFETHRIREIARVRATLELSVTQRCRIFRTWAERYYNSRVHDAVDFYKAYDMYVSKAAKVMATLRLTPSDMLDEEWIMEDMAQGHKEFGGGWMDWLGTEIINMFSSSAIDPLNTYRIIAFCLDNEFYFTDSWRE